MKAEIKKDSQAAWKAYNKIYRKFQDFNNENYLPAAWNITPLLIKRKFSPRITTLIKNNPSGGALGTKMEEDIDENGITGLKELENMVKEEWAILGSHVLY